jgi:spore coat polysaccharide biosynthesis protein SpsF
MQGRLRSTRLPAKGFHTFFGQTIWARMCDIALAVKGTNEVYFATGDLPENELGRPVVEAQGVKFFAGSEENVLERFAKIALLSEQEYILRITCDNYLIQPEVIDGLFSAVSAAQADYGYIEPLSHYAGEIIRRSVLLDHWRSQNYSEAAREHVTWDIRHNSKTKIIKLPSNFMGLNHEKSITLDNIEDFILMKKLESSYPELKNVRCLSVCQQIQK